MIRLIILTAVMLSFSACQQSGKTNEEGGQRAEQETRPASSGDVSQLPSVPVDTVKMLWEKCDYIDFVFYNLNFSINQNEQPSIRGTIRHIADSTPQINPDCKPEGRIFFQVDGRNALQGDFFLGEGCLYYIFYNDEGQQIYANEMTAEGVQFFRNVLRQVLGNQPQN